MLNKVIDPCIDRIKLSNEAKKRKNTIDDCTNSIKHTASDVQTDLDNLHKRTNSIIRDSFGQMQDIARTAGLSATHIARLQKVEKEAIAELESDDYIKLKIKKSFLTTLSNIENIGH